MTMLRYDAIGLKHQTRTLLRYLGAIQRLHNRGTLRLQGVHISPEWDDIMYDLSRGCAHAALALNPDLCPGWTRRY